MGVQLCSVGGHAVAPLHDGLLGEPTVPRALRAGVPLAHPAHEQHPLHGRSVPARDDGTTGPGIQARARVAAAHGHATPAGHPKDAGRVAARPAGGARSAWGVDGLREPRATLLVIQQLEHPPRVVQARTLCHCPYVWVWTMLIGHCNGQPLTPNPRPESAL